MLSWWLIQKLRVVSLTHLLTVIFIHKQKASFPQGVSTVDQQNPALITPRMWPKCRKWGLMTHFGICDVTWAFQRKFPIDIWLIYLSSFLDESSTSTHFEVLYYNEDRLMISSKSIFLCIQYSRGCFHFTKINCTTLQLSQENNSQRWHNNTRIVMQ